MIPSYAHIRVLALVFLIIGGVPFSSSAAPSDLRGTVTQVRDGDTIEVDGVPVRLHGLHAPEFDTETGQEAAAFMQALILHKEIVCTLTGDQSWDREIGVCWLGERDIAAQLVTAGLGRDCPRYSNGRYASLETKEAKQMKLPDYCR